MNAILKFKMMAVERPFSFISPTSCYQIKQGKGRWNVIRRSDGLIYGICRSVNDAYRLAEQLNQNA